MTQQHASYGEVHGPRTGEITRRTFMRRMLGVGVGLLSLEFLGGTLAFLWPNLSEGLGAAIPLGTADEINTQAPEWQNGLPYIYNQANLFFVNVPAAMARVEGEGTVSSPVPDPGANVDPELPLPERSVIALWRKCPHLGCQVPQVCEASQWFECLCHGSKYTVLGEKRDGPAPRGMDRFEVRVENGVYVVDTAEVVT
ncbi:MAG: Rieske 2Fe-2S domain-containing protein, partial [Actinomycetota bacterium]|nr:Rieske 2Fe-2S domain-containing protein [Actinomycetota bacterium]